jgi:soluble lytic murein transglycosylase-like protein
MWLNNTTMKSKIMVVALSLACAGCQTMGAGGSSLGSSSPLVQLVAEKAQNHNVPNSLAQAVVKVESSYDPRAYSRGNFGLGQIKCGTARSLGFDGQCKQLLDAATNLDYSMQYLSDKLQLAEGDWCKAATMYNNGRDTAGKTSTYCRRVMRAMD